VSARFATPVRIGTMVAIEIATHRSAGSLLSATWSTRKGNDMKVERLMTKDVRTTSPDQPLADAARLMWEHDCGSIPVVDASGRAVGMITDRDICMAAYFKGRSLHEITIGDSMAKQVLTCRIDDTIQQAEGLMQRAQVRRLPVTDGSGRVVGILSLGDIAREAGRARTGRSAEVGLSDVALTLSAVCQQTAQPGPGASAE
jgi:CBS domain-containing protein